MTGLRERKKEHTTRVIADAAFALFAARGFDGVTVAEVADRAGVSEATVFNYFRTKEDLVFGRLDQLEHDLLDAVRDRPAGGSVVAAFAAALLGRRGLLHSTRPEDVERLRTVNRVIAGSAALRARERQVYDDHARALAAYLTAEWKAAPGDLRPEVTATALFGVHRAMVDHVRAQVSAGRTGPALARRVRARAEEAFELLERGLA